MANCIKYRTVVNDAVVRQWEPMPEVQPPTLAGLVAYLKDSCGINPEPLEEDAWRGEGSAVRYGYHKQFWLPDKLTEADFALLKEWHTAPLDCPCPICGTTLSFRSCPGLGSSGIEEVNYAACDACDLKFMPLTSDSLTPRDLQKRFSRLASRTHQKHL